MFQQLFETGNDGIYACFKCQPLVPEVTIEDSATEPPDPSESQNSNTDEVSISILILTILSYPNKHN